MKPPNRNVIPTLFWTTVWAVAFITSAIVFKGNPAKDWIQAVLFIAGFTLWLFNSQGFKRTRC